MNLQRVDFLIIGATKSATTYLQRALQLDGRFVMPDPELHFFSREWDRGTDWYAAQFGEPGAGAIVGEKSNSYLDTDAAAERIASTLPGVRLVAQLRNPVDRAYSDYCMLLRRGSVGRSIEDYLDPRRAGDGRFLAGGFYGAQLRRVTSFLPRRDLLVVRYEDLQDDAAGHVSTVKAFLGADGEAASLPDGPVKSRQTPVLPRPLRQALRPLKPIVQPLRGHSLFEATRALVARRVDYPPLTDGLRQRLADHYRPDIEILSQIVQRDFGGWFDQPGKPVAA